LSRNRYSDRTGTVVAVGLLVLAVLGVLTVFHEPLAALIEPTAQRRFVGASVDMDK
jgi:uncharacterized iron-regulated membrane protein